MFDLLRDLDSPDEKAAMLAAILDSEGELDGRDCRRSG